MAGDSYRSFLGRGWKFPPEFNKHRTVEMVEEDEDIKESLIIILLTTKGERIMQPEFGSDVKRHVFDQMTNTRLNQLGEDIRRAILFNEPRVKFDEVELRPDPEKDGVLWCDLSYTVRATNNRRNIVYPFYLSEGTDISLVGE